MPLEQAGRVRPGRQSDPEEADRRDQLKILAELIAAAGEAKAKSLKVRISTAAKTRWEMPESIQEANVLGENADTIDLEIVFRVSINPRRSQPLMAQLGSDERKPRISA